MGAIEDVRKIVKELNKLADRAERLGLVMPNGALVDQLLGGIANDLEQSLDYKDVIQRLDRLEDRLSKQ